VNTSNRKLLLFASITLILFLVIGLAAAQNGVYGVNEWPTTDIGYNMRILGYNDIQHRPSYMPTVVKQGNRYILYASEHVGTGTYLNPMNGQMEYDGTSILDVTNPHHPIYLKHLPSFYTPPNNEARHVRVCAGSDLPGALYPGKFFMVRTEGQISHTLWDVTNPANPIFINYIINNLGYTHKESWDCTSGYITLPKNSTTWKSTGSACSGGTTGCNFAIYDLHDPYNPKFITDYGLVGQTPGSTVIPTPAMIHEAVIYTDPTYGTRIYGAYGIGVAGDGWLQIADLSKILALNHPVMTDADIEATQIGALKESYEFGEHTFWPWLHIPLPDYSGNSPAAAGPVAGNLNPQIQDFGLATTEGTNNGCVGYTGMAFVVDLNYPSEMQMLSDLHVPHHLLTARRGDGGHEMIDFCSTTNGNARFGSHGFSEDLSSAGGQAANWGDNPFFHRFNAIAWFGGGVHIWDLRDPYDPKDVAYFIPAANGFTEQNCATRNGVTSCTNEIGINNAATDDRGLVYIVDRYGTGIWVLELTGEPREALMGKKEH